MIGRTRDVDRVLAMVRGEYREMPGLQLTKPQICRMWTLEPGVCDVVVARLVNAGFLRVTPRGDYVLVDAAAAEPPVAQRMRSSGGGLSCTV